MVTSNHVHLLVKDTGGEVIAQSMQLIAGRIAQEFNQRKNRHGAFWEDRYHATAIQADEHLQRRPFETRQRLTSHASRLPALPRATFSFDQLLLRPGRVSWQTPAIAKVVLKRKCESCASQIA